MMSLTKVGLQFRLMFRTSVRSLRETCGFLRYENISPRDQVKKLEYGVELLSEPKLIPPKVEGGWNSQMIITGQKVLTAVELDGLHSGKLWTTFSILVTYDDDFGDTHHAEYCGLFTLQPQNDICPWPVRND
jgi:hypothetical protein